MPAEPGRALRLDPRALRLGYRLGSEALLVLLDLAARAVDSPDGTVVVSSYRDIARRLGVSKDTVGRRIRTLVGAGLVAEHVWVRDNRFETRSYLLNLDLAGVTLERSPVGA